MSEIRSLKYKDGKVILVDQRKLPTEFTAFICNDFRDVEFAIRDMVVRGAPAIGSTAAFGIVLAAKEFINQSKKDFFENMQIASQFLEKSRPTAVNLVWAIKQMYTILTKNTDKQPNELFLSLEKKAIQIMEDDIKINMKMASYGNTIVPQNANILTHCNTGALATVGFGTALGVIRQAHYSKKNIFVYADETRPRLQGARLTAWELVQENIPAKLIADNVAATLIRDGKIDLILVGADRIALNGDAANKIGTFMLSVVAKVYNVPFYVVAPTSTIDFDIESGSEIIIEERDKKEVTHVRNCQIAPNEIEVYNPAFDVTPHENITAIITEKGIIGKPFLEKMKKMKNEK
ncbi:MAG: S-methyl-5-thioribose-1-phosphate isomerase [Candidatus Cloacimonetes bacterium]|nr:S-methyl-5-thioribose-1-phosphate isomerase [Candidatus Cloacimonadota bacterium]